MIVKIIASAEIKPLAFTILKNTHNGNNTKSTLKNLVNIKIPLGEIIT